MPDIIDRDVIVLAPKERYDNEGLTESKDVTRRHLSLALRHSPVFDPDPIAGVRIRPSRNITGSKYTRGAGFQEFVDRNASIHRKASLLGQHRGGSHAHA